MIQIFFRRFVAVLLVILLQVVVFNHINLWGYAVPLMGVVALFYAPLNSERIPNMLLAFSVGLILDAFNNTPGVASGAMTATAFVQYPLLHAMAPKDAVEDAVPGVDMLGWQGYFLYISVLVAIHHAVYFLFEAFTFFNLTDILLRFMGSYVLTMLLAISVVLLGSSKKR